jgi:DNA-binding Xre family transcriptional regulator
MEVRANYMVRNRVKELAESQGYNMTSLARDTRISFNTIKRLWRSTNETANINTLVTIASVLKVTVNDLIEVVDE